MNQDIDAVLHGWDHKPGLVQARLVQARDGRQVIQMRVDLGVLQLETTGRPDGARPHGHRTYHEYLQEQVRVASKGDSAFVLSEEQCLEADREFFQLYHRRICWLALRQYAKAIRDADHTLAFMDLVKSHSPSDDYTQAHEQYRGFVLYQRVCAAADQALEKDKPDQAIDEIRAGLERMRAFFASFDAEEHMDQNGMVQHLREQEKALRGKFHIKATLHEQLEQAIASEDYEKAAQLRDTINQKKP